MFMKAYYIGMLEQIYYSFTDHCNHYFLLHLPCCIFSLCCLMHIENTIQNILLTHLLKWHALSLPFREKKF